MRVLLLWFIFMTKLLPRNILIIGHRGAKGLEVENSLLSFQKAADFDADGIEFDVLLCKSGEPVIFHDDDTLRITGKNLLVADSNLEQLQALDIGKDQKIPTLQEILEFACKKFEVINVELKGPNTARASVVAIESLVKTGICSYSKIVVTSFKWSEIEDVRRLSKDIVVGLLIEEPLGWAEKAKEVGAKYLAIDRELVAEKMVSAAIKDGLNVWVYTVNNLDEAKKMVSMGVTGIITDYPNLITKAKLEN